MNKLYKIKIINTKFEAHYTSLKSLYPSEKKTESLSPTLEGNLYSGISINAKNIENNGLITGPLVDITTNNYSGSGEISSFPKHKNPEPKQNFLERITNNQTFAMVAGTVIALLTLYAIYHYFGVNLSQFS
ncbi:MAG: hypothetical protein AAB691_04200 [Patescibacteria group bacterium]